MHSLLYRLIIMKINLLYLLIVFIVLNIRTYVLMAKDKKIAIRNNSMTGNGRISERTLLLNSLFFGFVGIGLGMITLRHKIRKFYFLFGVPVTAILNLLLFAFMYKMEAFID